MMMPTLMSAPSEAAGVSAAVSVVVSAAVSVEAAGAVSADCCAQAQKAAIMATARSRARIFFIVFSSLSKFVSVFCRLSPVMALFKRADRRKSI